MSLLHHPSFECHAAISGAVQVPKYSYSSNLETQAIMIFQVMICIFTIFFTAVAMPPLPRMAPHVGRVGAARQPGPRRYPQPNVEGKIHI